MDYRSAIFAGVAAVSMTGCMNLATKPSEITGSYTSDVKYQEYTCQQLGIEVNSLARREDQLAIAQEQRRKSGKVQAFWIGYGNGDGIEASELANIRGEKEAVRRALDAKSCAAAALPRVPTAAAATPTPAQTSPKAAAPAPSGQPDWRKWAQSASTAEPEHLYRCPGPNGAEVVTEKPAAGCTVIK
jgi:hypothetical protein